MSSPAPAPLDADAFAERVGPQLASAFDPVTLGPAIRDAQDEAESIVGRSLTGADAWARGPIAALALHALAGTVSAWSDEQLRHVERRARSAREQLRTHRASASKAPGADADARTSAIEGAVTL